MVCVLEAAAKCWFEELFLSFRINIPHVVLKSIYSTQEYIKHRYSIFHFYKYIKRPSILVIFNKREFQPCRLLTLFKLISIGIICI